MRKPLDWCESTTRGFRCLLILLVPLSLFACGLPWAAGDAIAMPLRPDVQAGLQRSGALSSLGAELRELAKEGYDRPAARKTNARQHGMNIVVLLIDFPDQPATGFYLESHYSELLFSTSTHPTGSMRDYYLENSYGGFDLTGEISGWHRMAATYSSYVAGRRGTGPYPSNARKMVEDAVRLADALDPGLDFRQFDNDGPDGIPASGDDDGVVDGLVVVHAGPGFEETGNPADIHSHFWTVVDEAVVVDGVQVFPYMTCPENGRVGVFAHEFGHNLGLPDLYEVDGGGSSVVGVWSLMSFGAWLSPDGSPFGVGAGTRPSHFDPWSKVTIGFVDPIRLEDNAPGVTLRPVIDEPDIVRLWTNGVESPEYFLIENRAPRGFDEGLPFASTSVGGLLIWHVDENVATNDDINHPRVALEQADGRADIEASRNHGDRSDPFTLGVAFTAGTTPSSRDYSGRPTQVRVDGIGQVAGDVFSANLSVEDSPALRKVRLTLDDQMGNGDGGLDATEEARVELEIRNIGLAAGGLSVSLASADPEVTAGGERFFVGNLAAGQSAVLPAGAFLVQAGQLPTDPYPYELVLLYESAGYASEERVLLVAGDVIGFASDVEEGNGGWTHHAGRPGYRDDWHVAEGLGRNGSRGWRCAPPGAPEYEDLTDARLETPLFALAGDEARLVFWHTMDAEVEFGDRAWDGGYVAISLDGGPFVQIEPEGNYFYEIIRNSASAIAERRVFSGTTESFERVEFDLTGLAGAARVRFHFGSDGSITQRGWVVDDVVVASEAEPYAVTFLTPTLDLEGRVVVAFQVDEFLPDHPYEGDGFMVYRQNGSPDFPLSITGSLLEDGIPSGFVPLHTVPLAPDAGTFVDDDVRQAEVYSYLLEDLRGPSQESRLYGPRRVFVPGEVPAPKIVRTNPNPFNPVTGAETATVQFLVPAGSGAGGAGDVAVRLAVYDGLGRLTRMLVDGPLPPGKNTAAWDGITGRGSAASSGVYFIRLEAGGKTDGLRFVLIR